MGNFLDGAALVIREHALIAFGAAALGGVVSSASPCALAVLPLVMGFVGGYAEGSRARAAVYSLAFILGLSTTFTFLGGLAALTGRLMGDLGPVWYWILAILGLAVGLDLLGLLKPWRFFPDRSLPAVRGLKGAFAIGLAFGAVSSPCATPVLAAILLFVASEGRVIYGMSLLFVYAMAHCVLIFFAGVFAGFVENFANSKGLNTLSNGMKKAGGALLVLGSLYFFYLNVASHWY